MLLPTASLAFGLLASHALASPLSIRNNDQGSKEDSLNFKIGTFNIRFGRTDNITVEQSIANLTNFNPLERPTKFYDDMRERPWSERRIPLVEEVLWNDISLLSMQEVLYNQLVDIEQLLKTEKPDFKRLGVGRADNFTDDSGPPIEGLNEFSPLFFRSNTFKLKSFDTFWLSETPFDISQANDTTNFRICGTAVLSTSVGDVTVMSTHWDHQSDYARGLAASLILQRAAHEVEKSGRPIFLMGDFNSETQFVKDAESTGYEIITGEIESVKINGTFAARYPVQSSGFSFKNLITATPRKRISGNSATFTGFGSVQNSTFVEETSTQIDFIFGGNNGGWKSNAFRHGSNFYDDGLIFSDHRPVMADITLSSGKYPA